MKKAWSFLTSAILSASMVSFVPAQAETQTGEMLGEIYVDNVNGNDANDGSEQSPLCSLEAAQQMVREKKEEGYWFIDVILREGVYVLDEPLVFTQEDSGVNDASVTWKGMEGENVIIDGGTKIEGWHLADEDLNIWVAPAQGIESRDLYVNNRRATRARQDISAYEYSKKYVYIDGTDLPEFAKADEMEVILGRKWKWCIERIASITDNDDYPNCKRIKITDESYNNLKITMTGADISNESMAEGMLWLENAYELLDEPGEWYLDQDADLLYYIPMEDENMDEADTVLGRLENLIVFDGTAQDPITNIGIVNMTFTHTTWLKPSWSDGLQTFQAAAVCNPDEEWNREWIPSTASSIRGQYVQDICITDNNFTLLGNAGVHLGRATKNSLIYGNTFTDLAHSAIMLGDVEMTDHLPTPANLCEANQIENNYIENVATTYRSNTGILVGFSRETSVYNNTLRNLPYTAISVGWGWGYNDFNANVYYRLGKNRICNNYIENVLTEPALIDGGGIYTLGRQDDSLISGNYIDGVRNEYGGIYLDEGSVGFTIRHNVLTNCVRNWLYKGDYNYIYDNFSTPAEQPDRDERLPIGDQSYYRFENNDAWDEEIVESIRKNAGVYRETDTITFEPMYRLYNPNSGEHFYTGNQAEVDLLTRLGWKDEGIGWNAPSWSSTPVYRLYNPNAGDHHYTTNKAECEMLVRLGWNDEGIAWYADDSESQPVYRLYNPNCKGAGSHHYTLSKAEKDWLVSLGWKDEGIGWHSAA